MTSMKYTTFEALELEVESLRQQLATLKAEIKSIGKAIDDPRTDLTMTMSEVIIDQKKQLAASQAAIKVKDAALQSAISAHGYESGDLHDALAIQSDDSALQAFAEKVREQCAHIIEAQDVDPSFKHRMADAIRSLKELPK